MSLIICNMVLNFRRRGLKLFSEKTVRRLTFYRITRRQKCASKIYPNVRIPQFAIGDTCRHLAIALPPHQSRRATYRFRGSADAENSRAENVPPILIHQDLKKKSTLSQL